MTFLTLLNWNAWSTELKIIAAIAVLISLHVLEEWVFPGGFHYQYNSFFGSQLPDRYPMCRLSDMITNLAGTIRYIVLTVICAVRGEVSNGMLLGTIVFCFLEQIVHTVFGIFMYMKLKAKGKTTIYGPGSITAYWGFTVFGVILLHCMEGRTILSSDWIEAGIVLGFIAVGCISNSPSWSGRNICWLIPRPPWMRSVIPWALEPEAISPAYLRNIQARPPASTARSTVWYRGDHYESES